MAKRAKKKVAKRRPRRGDPLKAIESMDVAAARRLQREGFQLKRGRPKWADGVEVKSRRNLYSSPGEPGAWRARLEGYTDLQELPWFPTDVSPVSFSGGGSTRAEALADLRKWVQTAKDLLQETGKRPGWFEIYDRLHGPGMTRRGTERGKKKAAKRRHNPDSKAILRRAMRGT